MQVVIFKKSKWWSPYWVSGGRKHPGCLTVRLGKIELRFGRGCFKYKWGRPSSVWAYENG